MSLTISPEQIVAESTSPLLAAPDSWPRTPLGQIATIVNGFPFKSAQFAAGRGKALIRIRDLLRDATTVGFEGEYEERYLVQPGELLIGMDGDFNSARWRGPEALLNQRVCKVVPDSHRLDLDFLTHVLPGYLRAIHDATSSTTVTHLSSGDIAQIPIPLPSLEEQRRLAGIFDIAAAKRGSATLHVGSARRAIERFRQSVLAAACSGRLTTSWRSLEETQKSEIDQPINPTRKLRRGVDPSIPPKIPDGLDLPVGWSFLTVAQLLASGALIDVKDGNHGANHPKVNEFSQKGTPFITANCVRGGQIDYDAAPKVTGEVLAKLRVGFAKRNDVILTHKGTVGRVAIAERDVVLTPQTTYYRCDPSILDPAFLALFFESLYFYRELASVMSQTTRDFVPISEQYLLTVIVPPREEQLEIARIVHEFLDLGEAVLTRVDLSSDRVDRMVETVLAKAFRGGLSRPDGIRANHREFQSQRSTNEPGV